MPEIKEALVTAQMKEENLKRLTEALSPAKVTLCRPEDWDAISAVIDAVDVVISHGDADARILAGKNLKWIHCCHAGLDKTIRPELFERGILLTGSSGRSAPALAEHVMMFLLALNFDAPMLERSRDSRYWPLREMQVKQSLYGKTVGIIGVGKTGTEVALRAKAFGMQVLG